MSGTSVSLLVVSILVPACVAVICGGCKKDSSPTGPGGAGSVVHITGKVIGQNSQPVSGFRIFVTGRASVNTDDNGAFGFASVTVPYDVTVATVALKEAYIYGAVTCSDPTLVFLGATGATPNTAAISGNIYLASALPQPDGTISPPTCTQSLSWSGAAASTGTLHALQWDIDGSGLPQPDFNIMTMASAGTSDRSFTTAP